MGRHGSYRVPGPRSTFPGSAPVILPPSITATPLTSTQSIPCESWLGFSNVARSRTGKGQFVDIALLDSAFSVLGLPTGIVAATGRSPGRLGNAHPSLAPYEPYPAADGHVVVAVANPRLWSRFCGALGAGSLEHDPRFATNSDRLENRGALNDAIRRLFAGQTVDSLLARLSAAGWQSIETGTNFLNFRP